MSRRVSSTLAYRQKKANADITLKMKSEELAMRLKLMLGTAQMKLNFQAHIGSMSKNITNRQ
jgi:hypothetical protein